MKPTQAEYAAADAIAYWLGSDPAAYVRERIAQEIAAHRAEPLTDPAQAHAAELETALTEIFQQTENFELMMFERMNTIRDIARALLDTLERERKAKPVMP